MGGRDTQDRCPLLGAVWVLLGTFLLTTGLFLFLLIEGREAAVEEGVGAAVVVPWLCALRTTFRFPFPWP